MHAKEPLKIGMAGFGNVGAGVYKNLVKNRDILRERTGREILIRRIVVRNLTKKRRVELPRENVTTRLADLLEDQEIELIVELIGGISEAYAFVKSALEAGKSVVTGNKALLAEKGRELFEIARANQVHIYYEAAVAGGIPIIKTVQESLIGNHIQSVVGIMNGTCNYILTRMAEAGLPYETALAEAQHLGFAEADPTLDINGWDSAHKAIILASLSYGRWVPCDAIFVEGIEKVTQPDIDFASALGYVIKLLAIIRLHEKNGAIEVRVQPSLVPKSHILASVRGVFNAILVTGDMVGETLFYGSGAGQDPTSSSVIGDIADAAARQNFPGGQGFVTHDLYGKPLKPEKSVSQYYLRVELVDKPGSFARIATILGNNKIGILSMMQPEDHEDKEVAPVAMTLHFAPFGVVKKAIQEIAALHCVRGAPVLMRLESL